MNDLYSLERRDIQLKARPHCTTNGAAFHIGSFAGRRAPFDNGIDNGGRIFNDLLSGERCFSYWHVDVSVLIYAVINFTFADVRNSFTYIRGNRTGFWTWH